MSKYTPSDSFHNAAGYLSNAFSLASVPNTTKLELYGLFKYLTVAHTPNTSRPSLFDFTGRAKWDAWNSVGSTYDDQREEDAEKRYLEVARELGWKEGATLTTSTASSSSKAGEDDIWDKDTDTGSRKEKSGGGMGASVSTISQSTDTEARRDTAGLHALVMSGNIAGLEKYLQEHPDVDLNQIDEYGYTPLHLASDRGHTEIVRLLLTRGVDKTIKDPDEFTALELAEVAEHDDIIVLLRGER